MASNNAAELFFSARHPIIALLRVRLVAMRERWVEVTLEGSAKFVADPASGRLHSGFATLALDMVMGGAVMGSLEKIQPIATAGLTAQHMRRPQVGEKLVCRASCDGIVHDVAHVSAQLLAAKTGEVLSTATGSFMIGTRAKPLGDRA